MTYRLLVTFLLSSTFAFSGTITCSSSSLPSFGNVYPYHSSTSLRYTVAASALSNNLIITAPSGFDISLSYLSGYSQSVTIVPVSGNITTTNVYVRFSPTATGSASGNVINSSVGTSPVNVAVSGTGVNWAIPSNYYSTVNTQTGAALKTILYNKISGHTPIGYSGLWNAYLSTDAQPNGKVWDVYSTTFHQASPYEFTFVTHQDGGSGGTVEGDKFNREHSFPQSWFNNASPMVSDLFHVLPTDKKVNSVRNNFPYGNVSSPTYTSQIGGKLGTGTNNGGYTGTVFEPVDEYKGDLARGYFYLATRYENVIANWTSNSGATDVLATPGNSFPAFNAWQLGVLLAWHNLDPVSDKEIKRNNAIHTLQNNRNPFIDSPQLVKRIWGGSDPVTPTLAATGLTFSNKSNTSFQLNWATGNGNRRIVVVRATSASVSTPNNNVQYNAHATFGNGSNLGNGNYVVYNGTGSSVTVSGLTQGTTYTVTVYEYNGWYGTNRYQTAGALTGSSNTLPVNWLCFMATKEYDNNIVLQWKTASETNNEKFEVERSTDNIRFETIASIKGAGTTTRKNTYTFNDRILLSESNIPEIIYYRIKQTDFDARISHSQTVNIDLLSKTNLTQPTVTIAPNPFYDDFRISFSEKPNHTRIVVYNANGLTVIETLAYHETEIKMDALRDFPAGIYILQIQPPSGNRQRFKIIKN